jgi:hypothetical protein
MVRTLQIATIVAFVLVMIAIHQGLGILAAMQGPQFVYGALFGGTFVGSVWALCHWLEGSSVSSDRPAKHQRLRDIDM